MLGRVVLDVRLHRGRQGVEDVVLADPADETRLVQLLVHVVLDACEREPDPTLLELVEQFTEGVDRCQVDLHIGLEVEQHPLDRAVFLDRFQRSALKFSALAKNSGES